MKHGHGTSTRQTLAGLGLCGLVAAVASCSAVAAQDAANAATLATAPTASELESTVAQLSSDDPAVRRHAYDTLTSLDDDALPAVAERLAWLNHQRLDPIEAQKVLTAFRHAAGSRRADDNVDIAPGALVVLAERRDPLVLRIAEPLLLMRALEHQGTVQSVRVIGDIVALDDGLWSTEGRRAVTRLGPLAAAAIIESKLHPNARTRSWARWGVQQLGISSPGTLAQGKSTTVLADILRAWGKTLDFDAMRIVISYVGSERAEVREAARWTMERYGRNAVWQLRQAYENMAGHPPEASWGWRRVMEELFRAHDEASLVAVRAALDEGLAAANRGDFVTMRQKLDTALVRAPKTERSAEIAAAYARLADAAALRDELEPARRALTRALAVAPSAPQARAWQAELAFVTAEQHLAHGVIDLPGYRRALALAPQHEHAREVYERLSGEEHSRRLRLQRTLALASAALLFALGVALMRKRRISAPPPSESDADETQREPTLA